MMPTAPGVVGPATILALGSCAEPSPRGASARPDFGPQVQVAHPHPAQLGEGTAGSQLALADRWRFGGHWRVSWAFILADALGMTGRGQRQMSEVVDCYRVGVFRPTVTRSFVAQTSLVTQHVQVQTPDMTPKDIDNYLASVEEPSDPPWRCYAAQSST